MLDAARSISDEIVETRRGIHRWPELAYKEEKTAALVASRLSELGVHVQTGVGGTGVVGLIEGSRPGKTVLLRADMDALPIDEVSDASYCSQNQGVMHACGHDGHTAMLLGAARLLAERRKELNGSVKLMFQPAEEGGFGAPRMIEAGLMEAPAVDAAFALHVDSLHYVGEVALRPGPSSAAADRFTITVHGAGGHAARPNLTVDPIVVAAHIVVALQTLVSREVSPGEPAVITVGDLHAGTTENVIPDDARIRGTLRTYSADLRAYLERRIREVSAGIAVAMRATADVDWRPGYPSIVNDAESVELVRRVIRDGLGEQAAVEGELIMGAEDFSYILQQAPGMMFRLGVRAPDWEKPRPTHSSSFDLDEAALPIGTGLLAAIAAEFLNGP
jgi:amidohydrolase